MNRVAPGSTAATDVGVNAAFRKQKRPGAQLVCYLTVILLIVPAASADTI